MDKVLFQFRSRKKHPSVSALCEEFGFQPDEIDEDYGLVLVDELEGLYVALVDESSQKRLAETVSESADPSTGFFSNPRVEPTDLSE